MNTMMMSRVLAEDCGAPELRTPEFYAKRPCPALVYRAARIVDEMLAERDA